MDISNRAKASELQVSIQYMWQHVRAVYIRGAKVEDIVNKIAITEMKLAEAIAERLNYFGGIPTTKPDPIFVGDNLRQMIENDKEAEKEHLDTFTRLLEEWE